MHELKIPKERIAVLIGSKGETKKELEEETNSKIDVDSKEGIVRIEGQDSIQLYEAKELIKAIARGFNPEIARLLLRSDYTLALINIEEYTGGSQKSLNRLRGRVIGQEGKSRKTIEQYTETYVCVYGKTVGIIGESQNVDIARMAAENLLKGSTHTSVFKWLEKKRKFSMLDNKINKSDFKESFSK